MKHKEKTKVDLAEARVTEEATENGVKVRAVSPTNDEHFIEFEVSGAKMCEWLSQIYAVRGALTPRVHNLIGTLANELAAPVHTG